MIRQDQVYTEKLVLEVKTKHHRHALRRVLKDFGFESDANKVEKVTVGFALTDGELSYMVHLDFPRSLGIEPKTHIDFVPEDKIAFYLGVMDVLLKHPTRIQQAFQSPSKIELPAKLEVKTEDLTAESTRTDIQDKPAVLPVDPGHTSQNQPWNSDTFLSTAGRIRELIETSPELAQVAQLKPIHFFTTTEDGVEYVLRLADNSKTVYRATLPGVGMGNPPVGISFRNDEKGPVHLPEGIPPETKPEPSDTDKKERIYRTNIGLLAANLVGPAMTVLSYLVENGPQTPEFLVKLCEGAEEGLRELIRWKVVEMVVHGDINLYGAPKAGRDVYLFRFGDVNTVAKARDHRVQQDILQKIVDFRHQTDTDTLYVLYQILVHEPELAQVPFPSDWNDQKKILGVPEFGRTSQGPWMSSAAYMNSNRLLRRYQLPVEREGRRRTEPVVFLTQKALDVFMLANGRSRTLQDALLYYRNHYLNTDAVV